MSRAVRGPALPLITQARCQQGEHFVTRRGALLGRQPSEATPGKSIEPARHVGRQRRRPGNKLDLIHGEAVRPQPGLVSGGAREVPRDRCPTVHSPSVEHRHERDRDRGDIAMPAELADEAAARLEGAPHASQHGVGIAHPV